MSFMGGIFRAVSGFLDSQETQLLQENEPYVRRGMSNSPFLSSALLGHQYLSLPLVYFWLPLAVRHTDCMHAGLYHQALRNGAHCLR